MKTTAYYLVRPRPELLQKVEHDHPAALELLCSPALWRQKEEGDGPERLKLTFLLGLLADEPDLARSILGPTPWGAQAFDRGWTLERFELDADADDVARHATIPQLEGLVGAEAWRASMIESKRKKKSRSDDGLA